MQNTIKNTTGDVTMENEKGVNMGDLLQVVYAKKKIIGGIIGVCTIGAFIVACVLPKQYSATAVVQTRNTGKVDVSGASAVMAMLGAGGASSSAVTNYIELMKTRAVLEPVIDSLDWQDGAKPGAAGFAKKNLDIQNTKGTNLIMITGKGRTPEEAQQISAGVVENFLKLQTNSNQQTQSLLVKFLNERIENAKKEADDSATKLAAFQREHKMFSPDEQAKLAIAALDSYDKAIGDKQVELKSAQAKYDVTTQQLNSEKAKAVYYQIGDQGTVASIRSEIVSAEVALAELKQKYTEKHPDVIAKHNQLAKLRSALSSEIHAIVNSDAASLNETQSKLLTNQVEAEADADVAKASVAALQAKKEEKEKEIGEMPEVMATYIQLESDAKIKQEIFTHLVQQCEQDKIQEAMEAMDIQVIDEPVAPAGPSFPDKKMAVIIGMLIGLLVSMGYVVMGAKRSY